MTNEEFEGHLMAALHGPNAEAIANRALAVVAGAGQAAVSELTILAHLEALTDEPPRGPASDDREAIVRHLRVIETRDAYRKAVRDRIRKQLNLIAGANERATLFAAIHLAPDEPDERTVGKAAN